MGKGSRSGVKHQMFKDKARNRVDDLQDKFSDLQSAIKDSRTGDVALLEAQVHQMLREWKAELNEPSPASSLQGNTHVSSDPSDILRHLQLREVEDDATSKPTEFAGNPNPKSEPDELAQSQACGTHSLMGDGAHSDVANTEYHHESFYLNQADAFLYSPDYKISLTPNPTNPTQSQDSLTHLLEQTCHLDYYSSPQQHCHLADNNYPQNYPQFNPLTDTGTHMSDFLPSISPPPSAFLNPKCALWDCNRPAQCANWCVDYCSTFHASLARDECPPGMIPVLRPGGIDLKDGPLFAALTAKIQGKDVGIPVCEGAASTKSPWNAPELFNLAVLEGESLREWLFFDKPRRAFESGNRKQRSLPDYTGRGWHESRKQILKEFGGLKRSYYMDPQPLPNFEWHLYEYEITDCDVFVLCRLEFKLTVGKKSAKVSRGKGSNSKNNGGNNNNNNNNNNGNSESLFDFVDQMGFLNEEVVYGPSLPPYGYNGNNNGSGGNNGNNNNNEDVDKLTGYYGT